MEEALVVLIVFGCIVLVTKLALDYAKEKYRIKASSSGGSSLTSSELRAIVRQAVEEVMDERLDVIERRLEALPEHRLLATSERESDLMDVKPQASPVTRESESMK